METYAPVVKLTSMRIILAYANYHDYEIMSFDVKTAFLHAKLDYLLYVKQIPGFPEADPHTVLRLLVAPYGLQQSAYEFYKFLLKLLIRLGLSRSELDHSVFIGCWTSPPHSSITMPLTGKPLLLIVPVHVDDGLIVTNSTVWLVYQPADTRSGNHQYWTSINVSREQDYMRQGQSQNLDLPKTPSHRSPTQLEHAQLYTFQCSAFPTPSQTTNCPSKLNPRCLQ